MTDSDRVNVVRAMAKRTHFSERAKELPADAEGREFPNYLTYSTSYNGREKIDRDWIIYTISKKALFCLPCLLFFFEVEKKSTSVLNSTDGMKISNTKYRKLYERFPEEQLRENSRGRGGGEERKSRGRGEEEGEGEIRARGGPSKIILSRAQARLSVGLPKGNTKCNQILYFS